jgi:16S rRNA (guanine966-N2)-methyltransferase
VRIIGGDMRGRVLRFPAVPGLRPTPDRVRETLFNWLGQRMDGRRCLDLFGGTGALSLEAVSRGAALAVVVERQRQLADALRATAQAFGAAAVEVHCAEAQAWLAREARSFDVIFLDPPFAENPWPWLLPACAARLAPEGRIYAEARQPVEPGPELEVARYDTAGQVHYHLLARAT